MVAKLDPEVVRAFRLRNHNLTARLDAEELLAAAGRCAVQDSPPGSALLALHARVRDVTADRLAAALSQEKSLVRTRAMLGAHILLPRSRRSSVHHRRASADIPGDGSADNRGPRRSS